ncbi:MAG: asparagine synthase-related protein [Candidatus Hodarchaeota archaeon]
MSGITGIISGTDLNERISSVTQMINFQRWGACRQTSIQFCNGAIFAKCGIPKSPYESPLSVSKDNRALVALDGFLLDTFPISSLIPKEFHDDKISQSDLVLRAYLQKGKLAFSSLRGQFALALWDETNKTLFLVSDRTGSRNLYWTLSEGDFIFSSQLKSFLPVLRGNLRLDELGVAEYLTFGYQMGDVTFFKDIRLLPPGSILIWKDGVISFEKYWVPDMGEGRKPISFNESVEQLSKLLDAANSRCVSPVHRVGLGLSGGLDSRLVAAYLSCQPSISCTGYAFNSLEPPSEGFVASAIAKSLGFDFKHVEFTPEEFIDSMEECTWLTEGLINTCEFMILAQRASLDVESLLWGYLGDVLSGGPAYVKGLHFPPWLYKSGIRENLAPLCFDLDSTGNGMVPEGEHRQAFDSKFLTYINGAVREHYLQCFNEVRCEIPLNTLIFYELQQRQRRRTLRVQSISDSFLPTLYPYLDDDVVEFFLAMNPKYKKYKRAYGEVLCRVFPELSRIIRPNSRIPIKIEIKFKRAVQFYGRIKNKFGEWLPSMPGDRFEAVDNIYNHTLKSKLYNRARKTLLSLARDRMILTEDYVLNLLDNYISGKKNAHYLILKLMTLEIFLRQMLDKKLPEKAQIS